MSGRELATALATLRPDMKVIFVSGYADDATAKHGARRRHRVHAQAVHARCIAAQGARVLDPLP